jgi:hypothetical protein
MSHESEAPLPTLREFNNEQRDRAEAALRAYLLAVFERSGWDKSSAGAILGIEITRVYALLSRAGLSLADFNQRAPRAPVVVATGRGRPAVKFTDRYPPRGTQLPEPEDLPEDRDPGDDE